MLNWQDHKIIDHRLIIVYYIYISKYFNISIYVKEEFNL